MIEMTSTRFDGRTRTEDEARAWIANAIVFQVNRMMKDIPSPEADEVTVDPLVLKALKLIKTGVYRDEPDGEFTGRMLSLIRIKVDQNRTVGTVTIGRHGKAYIELRLLGLDNYPKVFED